MKKYIAELVGTFALTLGVALSLGGHLPLATPLMAGVILGLMVYVIGHISGCHINPAITIGLWSLKKINTRDAIFYIVAQFLGAIIAFGVAGSIMVIPMLVVSNSLPVFWGELLGTFFFGFGVAAVASDKVPGAATGIAIGGSLFLGICFASLLSNGILNPAVAMGINSFSLTYVLGPIIGSVLGMQFFTWLAKVRS